MHSLFRFKRSRGPVDLVLGMAGVRLGERLLQVGPRDPAAFAAAAGKVGLTGRACAIVDTPAAAAAFERAAAREGVFVEVASADAGSWPYDDSGFDVAMVDGNALLAVDARRLAALLADVRRVVRSGGRVLAVYRSPRSLALRLGFESAHGPTDTSRAMLDALDRSGFGPARFLAAREGLTFVEAFRPRD